jgi:hypothetical protein
MSAQGDAGQSALLSKHTETQPAGSSATQDDEVIPGCMCHSASLVLEADPCSFLAMAPSI